MYHAKEMLQTDCERCVEKKLFEKIFFIEFAKYIDAF